MNPTKSQLEAMGRVKRGEPIFVEWLQSRFEEYSDNLALVDDITYVRWHQGRMQELKEILSLLDKASKL